MDDMDKGNAMGFSGRSTSSILSTSSTASVSVRVCPCSSVSSPAVLLLAWGNPLRRDDGVGWAVAHAIRETDAANKMKIVETHQLTAELAETIQRFRRVIFIDAGTVGEPGAVRCERVEPAYGEAASLTHHCSPATLLALAKDLYGAAPEATVLEIVGEDFGMGEGLSERVRQAVPEAVRRLLDLVCAAKT